MWEGVPRALVPLIATAIGVPIALAAQALLAGLRS